MSAMTGPTKTRKINHNVCTSTSIEDLDDHLLTQILFRLPSWVSVLACTPVTKRWYSLISDPRFPAQFSDHKMRHAAILKSRSNNIDDNEPLWTHLITMTDFEPRQGPTLYWVGNASTNDEVVFGSPKFNLGYLPRRFNVVATFMDLLLCSSIAFHPCERIYYVTNPLTKQWVALPVIENRGDPNPWAAFVCQQPYNYTQDYQFRVVLIDQSIPRVIRLLVYSSEIGMWKEFHLCFRIHPDQLAASKTPLDNVIFQCKVCNGVIYLHHESCFAAFNPFDVDETTKNTTTSTVYAKVLPSLQFEGVLLESSENLYVINTPNSVPDFIFYKKDGIAIEITLKVWKFNPKQVPLKWQMTFKGTCSGNVNEEAKSLTRDIAPNHYFPAYIVGMHPKDDNLIYMYLDDDMQFVSCNIRSRLIKPLKSIDTYYFSGSHRFEPQWWPTSVPRRL